MRSPSSSRMCPSPSPCRVPPAAVQDSWAHSHFDVHSSPFLPSHRSPSLPHTSRAEYLERPLPSTLVGSGFRSAQALVSSCCLCWLWSSRPPLRPLWGASFRDHLHLSCVGHQCFTMKRGDHRARCPSFPPGPTGTFEPSFLCLPKMSAVSLAHCQPGFLCWLCRCGRAPAVWGQEPVPAVETPAKLCLYQLFSFGQGT